MKHKFKRLLAILCIVMISITGCSTKEKEVGNTSVNRKGEKEVVIGLYRDSDINQLDAVSYNGPHFLYKMIYDGLVEDGGKEGVIPQLATDWEISEDGRTYTFHLREGVKYSDGSDFNAKNVVFNMKRWVNDDRHSSLSSCKVESVKALDDNTVKVVYSDPYYAILTELSYPRPVRFLSENSLKLKEGDKKGEFVKPIGTGQWMVESYEKDQELVLVPNPYYWGEQPKLDKIVFKVIPDSQARLMALKSGEIDILGGDLVGKIPLEGILELKNNSKFELRESKTLTSQFMYFNQNNEWFKDKNVRLAFNYAIDKEAIVKNLFGGVGSAGYGLYQKETPYVTDKNNYGYKYDKNKAIDCLKTAGFKDTNGDGILEKDGKDFEVKLILTTEEFPEWKSMSEIIQAQLLEVGVKVNINVLDRGAYEEAHMTTKDFDLCILRTASDSWVPHSSLKELFTPVSLLNGEVKVWDNKILYRDIQNALKSIDKTQRQKNYDKVFSFISEEAVTVPLYYPVTTFAVNKNKIDNFEVGVNNYAPINWTTLDTK